MGRYIGIDSSGGNQSRRSRVVGKGRCTGSVNLSGRCIPPTRLVLRVATAEKKQIKKKVKSDPAESTKHAHAVQSPTRGNVALTTLPTTPNARLSPSPPLQYLHAPFVRPGSLYPMHSFPR